MKGKILDERARVVNPILVVEDDKKITGVVKIYLENAGFRVTHFEGGRKP